MTTTMTMTDYRDTNRTNRKCFFRGRKRVLRLPTWLSFDANTLAVSAAAAAATSAGVATAAVAPRTPPIVFAAAADSVFAPPAPLPLPLPLPLPRPRPRAAESALPPVGATVVSVWRVADCPCVFGGQVAKVSGGRFVAATVCGGMVISLLLPLSGARFGAFRVGTEKIGGGKAIAMLPGLPAASRHKAYTLFWPYRVEQKSSCFYHLLCL